MTKAGRMAWQAALVIACVAPLAWLIVRAAGGELAEPVEDITHLTGEWALRLLLASLAVTPLRRIFGWRGLAPFRRTLGLLAFGYALLHFATYLALDLGFDFAALAEDVGERLYITAGFAAFLLLLPLAITSTRGWQRRLGRRWLKLHRVVYAAGALAVLHFIWLVKADLRDPLLYAALLAVLLGVRAHHAWRSRRARAGA
ncbi:MAG: sulfoxide reductase heme-binding subunit YedZ [Deltaproteobacteria bacterium]|nr:sulfoxide reductase heme-binding subunit YedZ [Deltaproteobacteria bacterium]MDD9853181.1 sulfoxide reductase heme-binding subunit YedZ [Deltaproteobacteria bacterium]MDD9871968.1 sulfoxide reductase heme-binding subunit YedZ [Deltaproteobacteria bacterium]